MTLPTYEVFAIRYATRDARRPAHFIDGDPHDAPMAMDYYVWLVRNAQRTFVVDCGFSAAVAAQRGRIYLRSPAQGLGLLGLNAATVSDVIVTHMHYDHVGTQADFPHARFHVQDAELAFATGRYMRHALIRHNFEVEDAVAMVRMVYDDRVEFHDGDTELAPGVTLHRIGGHTAGLQVVRVHTERGWIVLASDASHYYEHFETGRCFPIVFDVGRVLEGYSVLMQLADSARHVIPGHDPLVMSCYPPPAPELAGVAASLHVVPPDA